MDLTKYPTLFIKHTKLLWSTLDVISTGKYVKLYHKQKLCSINV